MNNEFEGQKYVRKEGYCPEHFTDEYVSWLQQRVEYLEEQIITLETQPKDSRNSVEYYQEQQWRQNRGEAN